MIVVFTGVESVVDCPSDLEMRRTVIRKAKLEKLIFHG